MTDISLTGVTMRYDADAVVDNLDLHVPAGSMFGLLGPSGCGKTTILRLIAGLLEPEAGDIRFDGVSVLSVPTERRRIGMVFQQHVLFPHMTVEENVAFGLKMQGLGRKDARPQVEEVLELVQLSGYNNRFPAQLSGGQQQRVALARAVATNPVVLLLDEPLSNLDARLRDDMRGLLRDVQRRLRVTTIFVTHDQTEAIELSDRMAVLFTDGIAQEGPPHEVFERPLSAEVARFLGSTNLIPARALCRGYDEGDARQGCPFETPFGVVSVEMNAAQRAGSGRPVREEVRTEEQGSMPAGDLMLSIRCEHIHLQSGNRCSQSEGDASGETRNTFAGRVEESVYKGGLIFYRITVEGYTVEVIDRSDRQFVPGADVRVTFPPEHVWVLSSRRSG